MKAVLGLVAILAISGFQATQAADEEDFNSALLSVTGVRIDYAEKIEIDGNAPSTLSELGLEEEYLESDLVEHVDIEPISDAIMIGLSPEFGINEWVAFIPAISNYQLTGWTCQTTVPDLIGASSGCITNIPFDNLTQVLDENLFSNTVLQVNVIKSNAAESLATTGVFPQSMAELGVTEDWLSTANVSNVVVMPYFNTVLFALDDIYGTNQWISLRPRISRGYIYTWTCKTTLPSTIATVSGCSTSVAVDNLIW